MARITPVGIRNEYWRRRLMIGLMPPPKHVRLFVTAGVEQHPRGIEALAVLLTGATQMDEDINPSGDCDMLKATLGADTFYLKVDCYAAGEDLKEASEDPADDEKTTRVFTCLLAGEY
jgi:hypothetical protein